ncbi:MAG: response regulator [Elusimicrobiota bacterium]
MIFGSKKTVLVVDDSKFVLMAIKNTLKKEGYKVVFAESGEEAIVKAKQERPDLILLDITLPGIDGIKTCFKLKNDSKTSSIPVVMCTSKSLIKEIDRAYSVGAEGYITKPIDSANLKEKVKNTIK